MMISKFIMKFSSFLSSPQILFGNGSGTKAPAAVNLMQAFRSSIRIASELSPLILAFTNFVNGQTRAQMPSDEAAAETWSYVAMMIIGAALILAAAYWLLKRRSTGRHTRAKRSDLRTQPVSKNRQPGERTSGPRTGQPRPLQNIGLDSDLFRHRVERLRYSRLPINSISGLRPSKEFEPLPISDDESLLAAIEQGQDESETDEDVRKVTLRVLAAFKSRNSVEAVSQIALYDLSPTLRSKAVSELASIDHQSVFETILLACADPTKEVRAAAALSLSKLSFDRTDAWHRIAESGDEFRMRQAARAAIEAGLGGKSFERLVYDDAKVVYEAFALIALLIKARETAPIFDAIQNHKDDNVKLALLHVLQTVKDESVVPDLRGLLVNDSLNDEVREKMREVIYGFEPLEV